MEISPRSLNPNCNRRKNKDTRKETEPYRASIASRLYNKYIGPPYCRAEMYAGSVAYCHLENHGEYADERDRQTDGQTSDRYITFHAKMTSDVQHNT